MVLTVIHAGARRSLWIEIKVDADESGSQIANYQRYIGGLAEPHRPGLVVLGPKSIGQGVPWLSWQRLRQAITESGTSSPYWTDFKTYLEEIRMADNYDEPLSRDETQVLGPARSLLGKTTRMLTPFAVEANRVWRGAGWPETESDVQGFLLSLFGRLGTFRIGNGLSAWHGLSAGLHHSPSGDARIGVWVWMNPRRVRERRNVLDAAATITPGEEWYATEGEWEVVGAYRPAGDFATHGDATNWLAAKYVQLRDLGLLEVLGKMRTTP
jgi:hypothetical protein